MTTLEYREALNKEVKRLCKCLDNDPLNAVIIDNLIKLGHEITDIDQLRLELESYRRREREARERRMDTRWHVAGTALAAIVSGVVILLMIHLLK